MSKENQQNQKEPEQYSVTISLYVDSDFIKRVNQARGGMPRSQFIVGVVEGYLENNGFGKGRV